MSDQASETLLEIFGVETLDDVLEEVLRLQAAFIRYENVFMNMSVVYVIISGDQLVDVRVPAGYFSSEKLVELKAVMADVPAYLNGFIARMREMEAQGADNGKKAQKKGSSSPSLHQGTNTTQPDPKIQAVEYAPDEKGPIH